MRRLTAQAITVVCVFAFAAVLALGAISLLFVQTWIPSDKPHKELASNLAETAGGLGILAVTLTFIAAMATAALHDIDKWRR